MPKINFQSLNWADREAIFKETASAMGMTPFAVEKDWWVSRTLNIIFQPSDYVLPKVQVEISCRSLREPFTNRSICSLVDDNFADRDFVEPAFTVQSVNPERTFLEKLFLLHEEFRRPEGKMRVDRLSRHMYDLFHLTKVGIADTAMMDKELYQTIVSHRYLFSRVGEVDYNLHNPKTLSPTPTQNVISVWKADYITMSEEMIYEDDKPSFDELIENLNDIRNRLQTLDWQFDLHF
jgi:hypothetical protein